MSFLNDLKEGEAFELRVMTYLNRFYNLGLEKNPEKKSVDLVSPLWITIETKLDKLSWTTWNLFVEFECNGKPSWIFKETSLSFFVCWTHEGTLVFTMEELQNIVHDAINNKTYRVVKGWDGWRVSGVLIPLKIAKSLCSRVFML